MKQSSSHREVLESMSNSSRFQVSDIDIEISASEGEAREDISKNQLSIVEEEPEEQPG